MLLGRTFGGCICRTGNAALEWYRINAFPTSGSHQRVARAGQGRACLFLSSALLPGSGASRNADSKEDRQGHQRHTAGQPGSIGEGGGNAK